MPKSAHAQFVDNGKLEESLLKRRAVRELTVRRSHQSVLGHLLKCVKERALRKVKKVEVSDARVAYPTDCSVQGVHCYNGSQLLAARFGSSELPRNHPHVAVFTLILQVTYMRLFELLKLKKSLVPSLLPCWSAVIAFDAGVYTKTRVRDGLVLMDWR